MARSLLQRVWRESVGGVPDDATRDLLDALLAYPEVPRDWRGHQPGGAATALPMVPLGFVYHGEVLRYFSLVTAVGAPRSVAAQELRLECLFPADEETEAHHARVFTAPDRHDRPQSTER